MSLYTHLNLNSQQFATQHPYSDKLIDQRTKVGMDRFTVRQECNRNYRCKRAQERAVARGNKIIILH